MNYWLDLFTGTTWDEFRKAGANISGFRQSRHNIASKINAGDFFICYLTGVMRWVGVLEVISPTNDTSTIWKDADFPVRFAVRPLVLLDAEQGILFSDNDCYQRIASRKNLTLREEDASWEILLSPSCT